jgi:hypothetical protein
VLVSSEEKKKGLMMYKTLAGIGIAAALLFAAPQGASALPGQGTAVNGSEATNIIKVHRRGWRHRHWRRHHHHHRRFYRKPGIYIHIR